MSKLRTDAAADTALAKISSQGGLKVRIVTPAEAAPFDEMADSPKMGWREKVALNRKHKHDREYRRQAAASMIQVRQLK